MIRPRPFVLAGIAGLALAAATMLPAIDEAARAAALRSVLAGARAAEAATPPAPPPMPRGTAIAAGSAPTATATLRRRVREQATRAGLLVERARALPPPGTGTIAVELAVSGSEKAVLGYADALARERPVAAFYDWEITAIDQANVRLTGSVVAAWR